jgi:perosamine synthetase
MIPVSEPVLGDLEYEYVKECLETGWISSSGRFIHDFEGGWAEYCRMKYGVAVSNGTVALQLALRAIELDPGDEVIIPSLTIISCALACIYNEAVPVLVDCDPQTWCMDVEQVRQKITSRTRAVMPVHLYGHPVDMDPLMQLAEKHGLMVIEDAAEAHGARVLDRGGAGDWRPCGGLGHLSAFSFYANKPITTGEGGMVLTNDPELADRLRSLRNLSHRSERRFYHTELGFNFRMTNLQAALGLAQLTRMEQIIERKRWIGKRYTETLAGVQGLQLPVEREWAKQNYWMYGVVLDEATGQDAESLANRLAAQEIDTRPFFLGMHEQPALTDRGLFTGEQYPVTERLSRQGLYLPSGLSLTESQLDFVCRSVTEALR